MEWRLLHHLILSHIFISSVSSIPVSQRKNMKKTPGPSADTSQQLDLWCDAASHHIGQCTSPGHPQWPAVDQPPPLSWQSCSKAAKPQENLPVCLKLLSCCLNTNAWYPSYIPELSNLGCDCIAWHLPEPSPTPKIMNLFMYIQASFSWWVHSKLLLKRLRCLITKMFGCFSSASAYSESLGTRFMVSWYLFGWIPWTQETCVLWRIVEQAGLCWETAHKSLPKCRTKIQEHIDTDTTVCCRFKQRGDLWIAHTRQWWPTISYQFDVRAQEKTSVMRKVRGARHIVAVHFCLACLCLDTSWQCKWAEGKADINSGWFRRETKDENLMPGQENSLSHWAENSIAVDEVSTVALAWTTEGRTWKLLNETACPNENRQWLTWSTTTVLQYIRCFL